MLKFTFCSWWMMCFVLNVTFHVNGCLPSFSLDFLNICFCGKNVYFNKWLTLENKAFDVSSSQANNNNSWSYVAFRSFFSRSSGSWRVSVCCAKVTWCLNVVCQTNGTARRYSVCHTCASYPNFMSFKHWAYMIITSSNIIRHDFHRQTVDHS